MNKAIMLATVQTKLKNVAAITTFVLFSLILPVLFAVMISKSNAFIPLLTSIMQGMSFPLVIAFVLQRDSFADTRLTNEGEFLALLFTRPISRIDYVLSKCLAVSAGVCVLLLVQLLVFHVSMSIWFHLDDSFFVNPARFVDIALGSVEAAAVVSLINAVPKRLGIWLFVAVSWADLLLTLPISEGASRTGTSAHWYQFLEVVISFKSALLGQNLYGFDLLNGSFTALSVVGYASNILLCLLGAAYILNRREFSYASD